MGARRVAGVEGRRPGRRAGGSDCRVLLTYKRPTSPRFSPRFEVGSQYLLIILSHAASDVFVKQRYDALGYLPLPRRAAVVSRIDGCQKSDARRLSTI